MKLKKRISAYIKIASCLSTNIFGFLSILLKASYLIVRSRTGADKTSIKFKFNFKGKDFEVSLSSPTDFAVIKEVFIDEEYRLDKDFIPKEIIDIGSNIGMSVIYWKIMYPRASVYAYEPDPETFKTLEKNTGFEGVVCINEAIGAKQGRVTFYKNATSSMSSSFKKRPGTQAIEVMSVSLSEVLLKHAEADLIKFDIEGAEYDIFSQPLNLPPYLIGEFHEDLSGHSLDEFLKLFADYESDTVQVSKERYIVELKINR